MYIFVKREFQAIPFNRWSLICTYWDGVHVRIRQQDEQPGCPSVDDWIKKMRCICIQQNISHKKE